MPGLACGLDRSGNSFRLPEQVLPPAYAERAEISRCAIATTVTNAAHTLAGQAIGISQQRTLCAQ
jgi:hypothetical protein